MKPHRGALILVLGILGLVVCFPCGIVAWVLGQGDLREIDAGSMDPTGRGLTQAGHILGIVATVLAAIGLVVAFIFLVFGVMTGVLAGR
ncbi:MAG: hypothetical protein KF833_03660 [Verrucomicrobiae bacterium]|nr:hypothetical protein [Verrucomicrobiae bacterium]